MSLKEVYNAIAEDWVKDHASDTWWIDGTNKFISFLKPGMRVLDVGCAGGAKSEYLMKNGLNIEGIDISENMVQLAKKRLPNINFFIGDIQNPLEIKEKFDGIFAQAVLLHIPKKEIFSVINNLLKHLKSAGYIYVAVKEVKLGEAEEGVKEENEYGYTYKRFFSYFTLSEIKEHFRKLGIEVCYERVSSIENTKWIEVIGKI